MRRYPAVVKYTLELDRFGFTALGYGRSGRVVNLIHGSKTDTAADVLRAARQHWPDAKRVLKKSSIRRSR